MNYYVLHNFWVAGSLHELTSNPYSHPTRHMKLS